MNSLKSNLLGQLPVLVRIGFLLLSFSTAANAQSYLGYNVDRFAGVHSLSFNPALATGSPYRVDVNIFSASAYLATDYLGLDIQSVLEGGTGFSFDDDLERFPSDNNNFFLNTDILGPSVLFNLNSKSSMALTTRVRGVFNISNINGQFYESISDGFEDEGDYSVNMNDFATIGHLWGEVGATYGRVLLDDTKRILRGGVTLKYLVGGGGLFGNSQSLRGNYTDQNQSLTTSGDLSFGYTEEFEIGDPEFAISSSGFGFDFGLVYELNLGNQEMIVSPSGIQSYRLRLGASVSDIGSINYKNSSLFDYNLDATVSTDDFNGDKPIDEILDENYTATERDSDQKIGLPTTLNLFADYSFNSRFHVSVQGSFSLKDEISSITNSMNNSFAVTPRFETKWISIYSPVGIRELDDSVSWGLGLRLGPVILGSGSIISNLISSSSNSADVYFALKVPIYKK